MVHQLVNDSGESLEVFMTVEIMSINVCLNGLSASEKVSPDRLHGQQAVGRQRSDDKTKPSGPIEIWAFLACIPAGCRYCLSEREREIEN